jgi:AcrR family transcriptional regulator
MIDEIKETARRQLAAEGADLSLRAIARELGMVSSALYRYFASRDELLTALIIDAYNAIGEAGERADAAITERLDLTRRWLAVANAWRDWALAHPAEYALIHGSPVPGYAAPADTIAPASRRFLVIAAIIRDGRQSGVLAPAPAPPIPAPAPASAGQGPTPVSAGPSPATSSAGAPATPVRTHTERPLIPAPLRAELDAVAAALGVEAETGLTARVLIAVTELFGALSFELFGQLNNTIDERHDWFDLQARMMADLIGLP